MLNNFMCSFAYGFLGGVTSAIVMLIIVYIINKKRLRDKFKLK